MKFYTTKDLAVEMQLHPRTVKLWWKKLNVKPTIGGKSKGHRWSEKKFRLLVKRWQDYWAARGTTPEIIKDKFAGIYEDPAQLKFRFK